MGGTGPAAVDEPRSWPRTAVVVLPWLLAAGLAIAGVLGTGRPSEGSPDPAAAGAVPSTTPAVEPSATPAAGGTPGPDGTRTAHDQRPEPRVAPGVAGPELPGPVRIAVLAAARTALGTAGLAGADGAAGSSWALDLRIGGIQSITDRFAVATVTGLVIEHDGAGWGGPDVRAVAVPLRTTDDGPLVTGPAWPLAPPPDASTETTAVPLDDPDPALVAVLEDAGWTIEEVSAVGLVDGELLRIELTGAPPRHDGSSAAHVVWLLDAPGGPRLLPLQPPHPPSDRLQENP